MVGEKIKALREAKSWSQAHLADAARLNIRTVQRIEAGEPCSYETLLSLAAALGVDVSELEPQTRGSRHEPRVPLARTLAASLFALPAAMFVAVNLLRSAVHVEAPYRLFASAGERLMSFATFNLISPVIFIGGSLIAAAACLPDVIRLRSKMDRGVLSVTAVEFRARSGALAVIAVSGISLAALLVYTALEQLHS